MDVALVGLKHAFGCANLRFEWGLDALEHLHPAYQSARHG
jgi:hypothetical protein